MNNQYDVIVVGGGAAGMMAAGVAASKGKRVLILEKNEYMGEKLKISGGGRCNITNAEYDNRAFLKHYGRSADFLYSPFSQFNVNSTFAFFESLGLPLIVQARSRAFPETEKAFDVYKVLKNYLDKNKVIIKTGNRVKRFISKNDKIVAVETNFGEFSADSFILATGGVSHPETGSTGDGFHWLRTLGHTVHEPTPTIVPLAAADEWITSLAGVSLSFMKITFFLDGKKEFSKIGKVLFTHFGLSGPLILNSASLVGDMLQRGEVTAQIDTYPDTDLGALDNSVVNLFNLHEQGSFTNKNKQLNTIFKEIAPKGTSLAIQSLFPNIDFTKPVHSVTKEERSAIVHILKALPVTITGLMGNDRAVSADGGVSMEEIDTRTMRSKKIPNLYIVGDLLHINRPSGGFSLQLCWTTGYVAGSAV